MAYQTSSGTFDQMKSALASFALANNWAAPALPVAKNYWRIVTGARGNVFDVVAIKNLEFRDGLSASVGLPDTYLFSSEDPAAPATDAWNANGWTNDRSAGDPQPWIGGFWSTPVEVREIFVETDANISSFSNEGSYPISYSLEYSDDGSNWVAFTHFETGGNWTVPGGDTYAYDGTTWPLSPAGTDNLLFMFAKVRGEEGASPDSDLEYVDTNVTANIYPARYYARMGRSTQGLSRNDNLNIYGRMPQDEQVAEWHFFADTTLSNYIHCAWRMTYRGEPRWNHLSMGVGDNRGLTHNGFAYILHGNPFFYPMDNNFASDRNYGNSIYSGNPFVADYNTINGNSLNGSFWTLLDSGGAGYPFPDDGAWPARGLVHTLESFQIPQQAIANTRVNGSISVELQSGDMGGPDQYVIAADVHPVSGYASMGPLLCMPMSGLAVDDLACLIGQVPNMRSVRIDNLSDGGEITQDTLTWKTFPRIRKTPIDAMDIGINVTSGPVGWAYNKVI